MPRDQGLEELVRSTLGLLPGLSEKAMFGGWAFLLHGSLLCGVRRQSLMLRVGPQDESWALTLPGVALVEMHGRRMKGYIRAHPEAYGSDSTRHRLLDAAVAFTRTLAKK